MLCQDCKKRPATYHVTKVVNGEKTEMHLCEVCAKERGDLGITFEAPTIHQLLAGLLNFGGQASEAVEGGSPPTQEPVCRGCGLTYAEFARTGKLGCGRCYDEFETQLEPLIRRIHGAPQHTGKAPARLGKRIRARRELAGLRAELQVAIQQERFERAAELRDRIRQLERNAEA